MARAVGFEPTTNRLTADCSTAELRPNRSHGSDSREGAYLVSPAERVNYGKRVVRCWQPGTPASAPSPRYFRDISRNNETARCPSDPMLYYAANARVAER